jgi:hypothetical protein
MHAVALEYYLVLENACFSTLYIVQLYWSLLLCSSLYTLMCSSKKRATARFRVGSIRVY